MKIQIPEYVNKVLDALESAGWEAFVVGGCVRDALLVRKPEDWDVCTAAPPACVKDVFSEWRTIDTGLKHGTVTVMSGGKPVEVTTYRIDGSYSDGRHPDSVTFTEDITADLSRRDFTMNAIAYQEKRGLVDPFGGAADIAAGVIRCVGAPEARFSEDALRIMRALRFAAVLGFTVEPATLEAVRELAESVRRVAVERVNVEFSKLLLGEGADQILFSEHETLEKALGTKLPSGVKLSGLPQELPIRLAALMPLPLKAMKYDNRTIRMAEAMAACAERVEGCGRGRVELLRLMRDYGPEAAAGGLLLRGLPDKPVRQLVEEGAVYSIAQLAVTGNDLSGLRGKEIGEALRRMLDAVIAGEVPNEKRALLAWVESVQKQQIT